MSDPQSQRSQAGVPDASAPERADPERSEFSRAAQGASGGLLRELAGFLGETRKWWLIPILLGCLLLGAVVAIGSSPLSPFLYALF